MPRPTATKRRDLGIYRRIYVSMWLDSKFRGLSSPEPNAQFLWMYLLCGPSTVAAPGVIRATRGGIADELGWDPGDLQRCFDELQRSGMVEVDWSAGVVWLPKATSYNPPASPNAVKAWAKSLDHITECPLKVVITQRLQEFLQDYGEAFLEPFRELLREPGAGAGTGEPLYPLSDGTVPPISTGPGSDPAPVGAGGSNPSPSSEKPQKGEGGDGDAKSELDRPAPDAEQFQLHGGSQEAPAPESNVPVIPEGGVGDPGCTLCGSKVAGVLFRQAGTREQFQGDALACHCWGCAGLKYRNDYKLPVPSTKNRGDWKRFEHAFPDHKRMRKRDRDRFTGEAAARTHRIFKGIAAAADRQRADQEAAGERAPKCGHCETQLGLVYRKLADGWEAGLCPECGGSPLYTAPPEFMGPPLRLASANTGWLPMSKTPAAQLDDRAADAWRKAAVDKARAMIRASVGTKFQDDLGQELSGVPVPEPPTPSDQWDDEAVSGEPPPI